VKGSEPQAHGHNGTMVGKGGHSRAAGYSGGKRQGQGREWVDTGEVSGRNTKGGAMDR
jgi:hypothetical protein